MKKMLSTLLLVAMFIVAGGVVAGCSESAPDASETVKDIQSKNKPQEEMPDNLKGRGMMRGQGDNMNSGPVKQGTGK